MKRKGRKYKEQEKKVGKHIKEESEGCGRRWKLERRKIWKAEQKEG